MSQGDKSYYDKVSDNLQNSLGAQTEGFKSTVSEHSAIRGNDNLSTGTKATALALNAVEAGVQAMGALGAIDTALESAILPVLGSLGMSGMACLPISKQLDPVMGIDVHLVTIPPSPAPIPMPHPYIGLLFRAKDFVATAVASVIPPPPAPPEVENPEAPTNAEQQALNANKAMNLGHTIGTMAVGMLGATVKIGGVTPRAIAGTPTKSVPHFPMGAGFHASVSMIQKSVGHSFLGSMFTLADGDPLCGGTAHLHLSCNDVGIASPHDVRPSKNTEQGAKTLMRVFLPTSVVNPIPPSRQILTNPVPTPMNPVTAVKKLFGASLGRFFKKKMKKLSDKLHDAVNEKIKSKKLQNALHKSICTVTGHPVDVATGNFFTDEEDFFLSGQLPISWERTYYSQSDYDGPLGYGWHHNYDIGLHIDREKGILSLRMNDGRPVAFELPSPKAPVFNRAEGLEAQQTQEGIYRIWNEREGVYYYFTQRSYDEVHLIERIEDKNGFALRFTYNSKGYLETITDSADRVLRVENDEKGRIVKITAPHPSQAGEIFSIAEYEYDSNGDMIRQTNANGDSMYFAYENHLMVKETWRNGLNWFFKYDGTQTGARCIQTWGDKDIYNHKLSFYEGLTKVENSLGHITEYYHKGGLVYKRIDPNGAEHTWHYNEYNELLTATDPEGNSYLYDYDKRGNKIQETSPSSATTLLEYENFEHRSLATSITDVLGGKWQRKYDENGNLEESKNPKGATTRLQWQKGLLQELTDALGNATHLEYDAAHNLTQIVSPTGAVTRFEYDALGRNTKIINAKGAVQELQYDLLGRVIGVDDFDGNRIALRYDGIDNLLEYKDNDQKVNYTYSGMWKLRSRSDARGTTRYYYDTEEQLTSILNERNIEYKFKLNEVGEVISEQGFDRGITNYQRDRAGRVIRKSDASGKDTHYEYTKDGQVSKITYPDGSEASYEYNTAGQLTEAENQEGKVVLERNILGQIIKETVNEHSITHEYNELGQLLSLKSSLGADMAFAYDKYGQLTTHQANDWESRFEYDEFGFEVKRHLGEIEQESSYDAIGRLTRQQIKGRGGRVKHHRQYRWGVNDRLKSIIDSATGTSEYRYTKTGHLEYAKFGNGTEQHRKADYVGNIYESENRKDRSYGYNNRLEKKGNWHYKYDSLGNLVEKYKKKQGFLESKTDRWLYRWNVQGMLEEVTRPDKKKVRFTYDALGRRLTKQYEGVTTHFVWNGNVPLHEWKQYQQRDYNEQGKRADKTVKYNEITWVFEQDSFVPIAKIKDNKKYSIFTDHLGTPRQMYNAEGEIVWERTLDLNGKVISGDNDQCPFTFQGQYYDKEINLSYNRFRYYDCNDGRYISQDPIGLESGEWGFYNYVEDSNTWVDVFGLTPKPYEVDTYEVLQRGDTPGDKLGNHHAPQKALAKNQVKAYPQDTNSNTAPAIRLPDDEHKEITREQSLKKNKEKRSKMSARQLLADDIRMLRKHTKAPNSALDKLIKMNKEKYKNAYKK